MNIFNKLFNYSEDYKYKRWKILGINFSIVKKYKKQKINICEEIKKHDIISFDIFDTLLVRPYAKPTDLFRHMEKLYKIKGFYKKRIRAEESARYKHIDFEDITLEQIYEEIEDKYKPFKEKEMELEERILTVHKENKKLYDYALNIGKKIIIASDMYLPKDFIEKILIKNGYTNYHKIYLSSDLKLSKASGNLYKYIIDDLKIKPSSMLHIGDNYHSDYENAKLYEIDAYFSEKIIDILLQNNIRARKLLEMHPNNISVSIMLGLLSFNRFNKDFNYWNNFGFLYGGPSVFAFMNWLKKEVIKDKIKTVLFVARDGWTLQKVFDLIKPETIETFYIYANRILYNKLLNININIKKSYIEMKSILEYYKDKDEYLKLNTPNILSTEEGYKFILKNMELYKKLAKIEYEQYKEYIEKFNFDKNNIGVVDTCSYYISSQKLIGLFVENTIGYYWMLLNKNIDAKNIKSFQKERRWIISDWDIMEFLITSPESPIKNLIDSKPVYSIPNKYEKKRMEAYEYISNGIVKFAKIAKDCFGDLETFISYKEITDFINIFLSNSNNYDKKYMKQIKHSYDANHNYYIPLIKKWFIKESGKKYYLFSFIPIMRKEEFLGDETKYYLFNFIPIFKTKVEENIKKYYLFFVLNIFTVKKT